MLSACSHAATVTLVGLDEPSGGHLPARQSSGLPLALPVPGPPRPPPLPRQHTH